MKGPLSHRLSLIQVGGYPFDKMPAVLTYTFHWTAISSQCIYLWQPTCRERKPSVICETTDRTGPVPDLKFCMNCLKVSVRRASGTTMLMGTLLVSTLSFFTFIRGPNGRNSTMRRKSLLAAPLKVSSYMVPLSFSVRVMPRWLKTNMDSGYGIQSEPLALSAFRVHKACLVWYPQPYPVCTLEQDASPLPSL